MADTTDILLSMISEQWSQARQSEKQRATMTNYIIVITAAILGYLVNEGPAKGTWPLTALLMVLGLCGAVATEKLYERFNFHMQRVRTMIRRLDDLHPDAQIRLLQDTADDEHKKKFRRRAKLRLHCLWLILNLAIAVVGVVTTIIAATS